MFKTRICLLLLMLLFITPFINAKFITKKSVKSYLTILGVGFIVYKISKKLFSSDNNPGRIRQEPEPRVTISHIPSFVCTNRDRDTLLHEAARANNANLVRELVEEIDAPIYMKNLYGETPASIARSKGNKEIQDFLAAAAKSYEENRSFVTTVANESISQATPDLSQYPLAGHIITEYAFGPIENAYNLYP